MATEKKLPKEVVYKFERANGYQVIHVNGVWGGMTYPNEIRMELYSESIADPEFIVHEITADGALGKEVERLPKVDVNKVTVVRDIHVAAIMTPAVAEFIGKWLLEQVKQSKGEQ